jgi:hypothetical protein
LEQASQKALISLAPRERGARIDLTPSYFLRNNNRAHGSCRQAGRVRARGSQTKKGGTMSSSERRLDTRVNIRVPLRFRVLNNPGATEQVAESENISQRGIFFSTAVPMEVGTPVELSLRMPPALAGKLSSDVKCFARVVHVQPRAIVGGKTGIGLHIERYEAKASVQERWAS